MSDKTIKKPVVLALEQLESRMLYSADVAGMGFAGATLSDLADSSVADDSLVAAQIDAATPRTELVFVDATVPDAQSLIDEIKVTAGQHCELVAYMIERDTDGITFISNALAAQAQVDAVHILSHGSDASVRLGNGYLDIATSVTRAAELSAWGSALATDADIVFYGCDLVSEPAGRDFVANLSDLTGADIAASTDLTGHRDYSGDWELEYHHGAVETPSLLDDDSDWRNLLAVINVTTTSDVVDGDADLTSVAGLVSSPGADGAISLREAIIAAEADPDADEIQLSTGTYTLALSGSNELGDLNISNDLVIRGAGAGQTTIDALGIDRVFHIAGGSVDVSGVTITGGKSPNGKDGGGMLVSSGSLMLNDVYITQNETDGKTGGGMFVDVGATVTGSDVVFRGNEADPDTAPNYKDGGALYNEGDVTLERVSFESNLGANGGAVHNHGTLQLTDAWFINNTAASAAGALDNHSGGTIILDRVTFESNVSSGEAGALRTDGPSTLRNVTYSGNSAATNGGALAISGGSTVVTIENSTFRGNIASGSGGSIDSGSNNVTVANTIFSGSTAGSGGVDIEGNVTSLGYNLFEDAGFGATDATDIVGESALLGPLLNNGGFVKTHALQAGSPAINTGGGSPGVDATGVTQDQLPDIGAFESRDASTSAMIFWADQTDSKIYRATEDSGVAQPIIVTAEMPFDIEVDIQNNRIYWLEGDGNYVIGGDLGSLYSADLDGNNITQLLSGINFPTGLALDVASNHLYLTLDATTTNTASDPYVNEIVRYDLDGTNPVLIASGEYTDTVPDRIRAPTDIEYDPASQRLFWTDRGSLPFNSDADDEIKLVDLSAATGQIQALGRPSDFSHSPTGLTVLPGGQEIYWANTKGISYFEYDNSVLSESSSASLSSVGVVGVQYFAENDTVYLSNYDGSIQTISLDLSVTNTIVSGLTDPAALAVMSSDAVSLPLAVTNNALLTVDEGAIADLDSTLLRATDSDTTTDNLVYSVTSSPANGRLIDSGNVVRTTFTQTEINNDEISYEHFGGENTSDSFVFSVTDGVSTVGPNTFSISVTPQNDLPVAVVESFTVNEGSTSTFDLAVNDSDAENRLDVDSIVISGGPTNGALVVNGDGTVDYTHNGSETTSDSFSYTIDDLDGGSSNSITVNLTITPQNDPPVAVVESYTVNEGSTSTFDLAANDNDAENRLDVDSIVISGGPTNGAVVVNGDGTVDYTHNGSETTSDSFSYTIDDLDGGTSNAIIINLTITPQNDPPVAVVESFTVNEGSTSTFDLAANDTDAENRLDFDSIVISGGPTNGSIVVNGDGTVDYTHNGSETTSDSFSYTIDDLDGGTSNTIIVNLTITPQNDPPVAVVESFTVNEGSTGTYDLAANDSDAENRLDVDSIVISGGPANGAVTVNGDGTVDYTHNGTETTADSFSYTIDDLDGGTSNTITVNLTITPQNDPPVAVVESYTVNEGSTSTFDLAVNDTDAENRLDVDSIVISGGPTNGALTVNGDGTVDYTHDGSETTTDSFSYTIDDLDGGTSNSITVNLTITPQNDPPVAMVESYTVNEGSTSTFDLAANDADAENRLDVDSIVISGGPNNGAILINGDGAVDYTHNGSETTADSFSYTIDDLDGGTSNTIIVNLTITPQNDPPVAVLDSYTVNEGSISTFNLAANDSDAENRLDVDSIVISGGPTNGTLTVNGDGTVDYTHNGTETSSDSFSYTIDDLDGGTSNTITVNLTITPQNDPPVAVVESYTVNEGSTSTFDLAANDTDAENRLDVDSIVISGGPANGAVTVNGDGTVDYTHNGSETTSDSFSYTIDDLDGGTSNTITVNLTITPQNDPPVAVVESYTVNEGSTSTFDLAANDTDAENRLDVDSIVISGGPTNGAIVVNGDGTVDYTHNGSETTSDSFSYTIDDLDGGTSNAIIVNLTITPQNDPPVAMVESYTVNEGSTSTFDLAANDTDAENRLDVDSIVISAGPINGAIVVNGDGTVDYTHNGSETASDSFSYTIDDLDGGTSNTIIVGLTITPQNDAPIAVTENYTVNEGSTSTLDLAANDTDAENRLDVDSITITSAPANGAVIINGDGSVDYAHDGSETASDSFEYTIDDLDGGTSNSVAVGVSVTPQNDMPQAVIDSFSVQENTTTTLHIASNDIDDENRLDLASIVVTNAPSHGSVLVKTDGTVDYSHDGSETTSDIFSYTISDLDGSTSVPVSVTIAIGPVNDSPIAGADSFSVAEGASARLAVAANDTDSENRLDLAGIAIASMPAHGSVTVNNDGTVDYSHDGSETVSDNFSYSILDLDGAVSNSVSVSLTISPLNDIPAANDDSFTLAEGATSVFDVLANDSDAENRLNAGSVEAVSAPSNGVVVVNADGTVAYTHDGSETTSDSFNYRVGDLDGGTSNTATVSLTISPENDVPLAVDDSFSADEGATVSLDVIANDSDSENRLDVGSILVTSPPANGAVSVNSDGTVDYTHDGSETTADSFRYTVEDLEGLVSVDALVSIAINPRNDAPDAVADSHIVTEGGSVTIDLIANDTDAEFRLDPSTIVVTSPPAYATLELHLDGTVTYTHDGSESPADSFAYTVADMDGGVSAAATVNMTVVPDNDSPKAVADAYIVDEGATAQLDVLQNDTDTDDGIDVTSLRLIQGPAHGVASINSDGTITYRHDGSETTADRFVYQVNDRAGSASESVLVTLRINPVNDVPIVNRAPVAAVVDATVGTIVLPADTFTDADQELLRITATLADGSVLPPWMEFDTESLTFSVDSNKSEAGVTEVLIVAEDAAGERATAVLQISIEPEIQAALMTFDTIVEFPELVTKTVKRESDKPAPIDAANDSKDTTPPAASSDNRARESRDDAQAARFVLDEDVAERELEIQPVEQHSKNQPKRVVQLEPVVENSPLRKLIELDKEQYEGFYRSVSDSIENMKDDLNRQQNFQTGVLASSAVAASSLAVGYALWILRGGSLIFSVMASMPAWRFVDPFPVLGNQDDPDAESDTGGESESLQSMVRQKSEDSSVQSDERADRTKSSTGRAAEPRDVR